MEEIGDRVLCFIAEIIASHSRDYDSFDERNALLLGLSNYLNGSGLVIINSASKWFQPVYEFIRSNELDAGFALVDGSLVLRKSAYSKEQLARLSSMINEEYPQVLLYSPTGIGLFLLKLRKKWREVKGVLNRKS
ncbi:hypothetical protein Rhal01_03213 [Rubritalea halochordaticola]|uniref:Uncharacterized protein n=1 Tax=Rubritalea halochordaticola TaxID=714537 RepID=A0ABP9V344_9BACT